ncbi:mitochondrial import receptor subunit Tom5p [Trichomonascus vanleenenianus]
MFGGPPPPPSDEELKLLTQNAQNIVKQAIYIAAALWTAPLAFDLIKGRF